MVVVTNGARPSITTAYEYGRDVLLRAREHVKDPVAFTYWNRDRWTIPREDEHAMPVVTVEAFPAVPVFVVEYAPGTLVRFCALPIGPDGVGTVWCALVVHGAQHAVVPVDDELRAALEHLVTLRPQSAD